MATIDLIELRLGSGRWLRAHHRLVSLLGGVAIVMSPVSVGWQGTAVGALILVHALTSWRMSRFDGPGRIVIGGNGNATLFAGGSGVQARYRGAGWASRWLCVLPLETLSDGRHLICIVCRSRNSRDAYRRLLVRLRADGAPGVDRDPGWT